jgi:hypothetical protein
MDRWFIDLLLSKAACIGADPKLFDAFTGEKALDALSYCGRCTVVAECDRVVAPRRSYFDGVAADRVWNNGRIVRKDRLLKGDSDDTSNTGG